MLFLLIAKSGSGKTEIAKHFQELVAFTTRPQRENETEGVQYYFKDRTYIENEISKLKGTKDDFILEYGMYGGHYYGTLKSEFDDKISKHDIVINTSEIEGALILRRKFPEQVRLIWIEVDEITRVHRLKERAQETGESEEMINKRIYEDHRDKERQLCDFVIYNDKEIEQAVRQVEKYAVMLKNENKSLALDSIKLLKEKCLANMIGNYYEMMISHDLYEQFNKLNVNESDIDVNRKMNEDVEYLESMKSKQPEEVIQAIDYLIDYLHGLQTYFSMKV